MTVRRYHPSCFICASKLSCETQKNITMRVTNLSYQYQLSITMRVININISQVFLGHNLILLIRRMVKGACRVLSSVDSVEDTYYSIQELRESSSGNFSVIFRKCGCCFWRLNILVFLVFYRINILYSKGSSNHSLIF